MVELPLGLLGVASVFLGGLAILNELRRREAMRSNLIYRKVIETFPDCLNVKDMEGRFVIANAPTAALMKAASTEVLIGQTDFQFYPPDVALAFLKDEQEVTKLGKPRVIEQRAAHHDGNSIWLSTLKVPLIDEAGKAIGLVTHNRDISDRKRLELQLAQSQQHFTDALANMADGLAMFDAAGVLVFCNEQYRNMFAKTADLRVPGNSYREIFQAALQRGEFLTFPLGFAGNQEQTAQDLLHTPNNTQFQLFNGCWIETRTRFTIGGACFLVCSDITQIKTKEAELVALNAQLTAAANTDGLTGLANRRAFDQHLTLQLKLAGRGAGPLSLMLIDVDRFKAYNDAYGHPAGDECLKTIAECLKSVARRPGDLAARYGGEEMAVLLPLTTHDNALDLAQTLRKLVREQTITHIGSQKGIVTVSIGVASLEDGEEVSLQSLAFLRRADEALYNAKAAGRDLVRYWSGPKLQTGTAPA